MLRSMPNLPFMTRMYQYHVRSKKPQKSGEVTPSYGTQQNHFRDYGHRLHFWLKVKKGVAEK